MEPFELLKKIAEIFEQLQIPYLITGSVSASLAVNGFHPMDHEG